MAIRRLGFGSEGQPALTSDEIEVLVDSADKMAMDKSILRSSALVFGWQTTIWNLMKSIPRTI